MVREIRRPERPFITKSLTENYPVFAPFGFGRASACSSFGSAFREKEAENPTPKRRRLAFPFFLLPFLFTSVIPCRAQWRPLNPVESVKQEPEGVVLKLGTGELRIQFCTDSIVHFVYSPTAAFPGSPKYIVVRTAWPRTPWTLTTDSKDILLTTARLKLAIARQDSTIAIDRAEGKPLFEVDGMRMTPAVVNGERTYHSELWSNLWGSQEAFYGLGQHQAGVWNYHGESVELSQDNTNISIPFFVSSRGYGILWNNDSASRFNNRFLHALYLSSSVADTIDFYFIYGPSLDKVIAGYRELTGAPPLLGKWAYGYWQSKNRYDSQKQLLAIAAKYRALRIPIDNIVQDWFWWKTMGDPVFNKNYPDPQAMIAELHREHFHIMFSWWPYFDPGTPVYEYMREHGYFIDRSIVAGFHPAGHALYDAFDPAARKYNWDLIDRALFQIGADAWWLDTDEPETEGQETNILMTHKVFPGNGARYANAYPLLHARGIYEGQRQASDEKRVFILSRSAFAGSQRYGVTAWSGDVESNWLSFARQIPAGLNYGLSGLPYWTTDIGGFVTGHPDDPAYRELFVRWFEYGTFCPIFRVHGTRVPDVNELWSYGRQAQAILVKYDELRYRLMPYIYSLAWMATSEGYTPMRGLVMDFPSDVVARNISDQFLYGPALLVNPVTQPGVSTWRLYLPKAKWYDFWTGRALAGAGWIDAPSPLGRMPLYARAGSILPLGPEEEWATEKPADPIELRIYPGANGSFTLYEDENDNYDYERGLYATIPVEWDDVTHTLTLGKRQGQFPGMLKTRTFRIVLVRGNHGTGAGATSHPDKIVRYAGSAIQVNVLPLQAALKSR